MAELDTTLQELHSRLAEFAVVLENEATALETLQADALAPLLDKKNHLALAVAQAWSRLVDSTQGEARLRDEVERGLSATPARNRTWRDIRRLAHLAEQLNASNGRLIEAQLQRTRQALDILQQAARRSTVYGADGQMHDFFAGSQRSLDKA